MAFSSIRSRDNGSKHSRGPWRSAKRLPMFCTRALFDQAEQRTKVATMRPVPSLGRVATHCAQDRSQGLEVRQRLNWT